MASKKSLFIMAVAAVLLLVAGFIFYFINSFTGNPVSAVLAEKAIKTYAEKTWPSLELEVGKAHYNFKVSSYVAEAASKTSIDTHFSIYCKKGKVQSDGYEDEVLSGFNTLDRLEDDYEAVVKPLLSEIEGLEDNRCIVVLEDSEYQKAKDKIEIDIPFRKEIDLKFKITFNANIKDISHESFATLLEKAHKKLKENNCIFTEYDVYVDVDDAYVQVSGVSPAVIESGELAQTLVKADTGEGYQGIRIFRKGGKE